MTDKKDYYKRLGVAPSATRQEIKASYRALARKHRPDINPAVDHQEWADIVEAYEVLSDEEKRQKYDSGKLGKRETAADRAAAEHAAKARSAREARKRSAAQAKVYGDGIRGRRPTGAASSPKPPPAQPRTPPTQPPPPKPPPAQPRTPPVTPTAPRRSRRRALTLTFFLVLVAIALAVALSSNKKPAPPGQSTQVATQPPHRTPTAPTIHTNTIATPTHTPSTQTTSTTVPAGVAHNPRPRSSTAPQRTTPVPSVSAPHKATASPSVEVTPSHSNETTQPSGGLAVEAGGGTPSAHKNPPAEATGGSSNSAAGESPVSAE